MVIYENRIASWFDLLGVLLLLLLSVSFLGYVVNYASLPRLHKMGTIVIPTSQFVMWNQRDNLCKAFNPIAGTWKTELIINATYSYDNHYHV